MRFSGKQNAPSPRLFLLAIVLLVLATSVRFAALDRRTIHIDEGMGIRAAESALIGEWKFYPANGHGPTFFYAGAVVRMFFGDSLPAARALTATACIAMIGMLFFVLRKDLGAVGSLLLTASLGFSSGMTFYSVYFIHESLFLLFTACAYLSARSWFVKKRAAAVGGFFMSLALMYATKETAILTVASWVIAAAATWFFFVRTTKKKSALFPSAGIVVTGICLALFTHIIFFSSFFQNTQGIIDSFTAPFHWAERAQVMHGRPFAYFLSLLSIHEFSLLIAAVILAAIVTMKRKWTGELFFLALWFVIITLFYSVISYKTPWCIPNMILPLALFVAFALSAAWQALKERGKMILGITLGILFFSGVARMTEDVFLHPDREQPYDYAYLQSDDSLRAMIDTLHKLSVFDGRREYMPLQMIGTGDELLYVLTDRFDRSYSPFTPNLPVYVNYQNDAEEFAAQLSASSDQPYVRLIYTYIQHVNQVDLFVRQSLWDEYRMSGQFVAPQGMDGEAYDYR